MDRRGFSTLVEKAHSRETAGPAPPLLLVSWSITAWFPKHVWKSMGQGWIFQRRQMDHGPKAG